MKLNYELFAKMWGSPEKVSLAKNLATAAADWRWNAKQLHTISLLFLGLHEQFQKIAKAGKCQAEECYIFLLALWYHALIWDKTHPESSENSNPFGGGGGLSKCVGDIRENMEEYQKTSGTFLFLPTGTAVRLMEDCMSYAAMAMTGARWILDVERRLSTVRGDNTTAAKVQDFEKTEFANPNESIAELQRWLQGQFNNSNELIGRSLGAAERAEAQARQAFVRGENDIARAREEPRRIAAEIMSFVRKELSGKAIELWTEWEKAGYSIKAAAKKLKLPYVSANRLFHAEIEPFLKKHNLIVQENGKGRELAFNDATEAERYKHSGDYGNRTKQEIYGEEE